MAKVQLIAENQYLMEIRKYGNDLLTEIAHIFPKQYELAEKCAKTIVERFKEGKRKFTIDTNEISNEISLIDVDIIISNSIRRAQINMYKPVSIEITLLKDDIFRPNEEIISFIKTAIAHELMHAYVYIQKKLHGAEKEDIPDYYSAINTIMRSHFEDIEYYFSRGLYLTYYQELQAFISQAWIQVKEILNKKDNCFDDKKSLLRAFRRCDTYEDFSLVAYWCEDISNHMEMCEHISIEYKKYGILMTPEEVNKRCKKINKKLIKALNAIANSIYLHWEEEKCTV